jgi:hypothetical protein
VKEWEHSIEAIRPAQSQAARIVVASTGATIMVIPDRGTHLRVRLRATLIRGQQRTADLSPDWLTVSAPKRYTRTGPFEPGSAQPASSTRRRDAHR